MASLILSIMAAILILGSAAIAVGVACGIIMVLRKL